MAPNDVKTENIRPEEIGGALSAGQVDAIATWEPLLAEAKKALGAAGVTIDLNSGFSFWFHLAGQRESVRNHPATVKQLLRALLQAERFVNDNPAAASAIVAKATRLDPGLFEAVWPNFRLRLVLPQGLLAMLEDQAQWAIANRYAEAAEVPNFLETVYLDGMLAVRPETVSIVR
jgi:NitT/TauT family transport system substrate-binding protein